MATRSNKKLKTDPEQLNTSKNATVTYSNAPCVTWVYTDHERKYDFVCVVVPVIGGSQDVYFNLSEDGMKLVINYTWPLAVLSPTLFDLPVDHPKVHAFRSRLLDCEYSQRSAPTGKMVVDLPIKVQRELGTWTKQGKIIDGASVILLEFRGYQREFFIKQADTSITFD